MNYNKNKMERELYITYIHKESSLFVRAISLKHISAYVLLKG